LTHVLIKSCESLKVCNSGQTNFHPTTYEVNHQRKI
jgi:hypothetical protein